MRGLLLPILVFKLVSSFPLPAGDTVYKVPNKFFGKPNIEGQQSNDSLYNFLSQIHYGGISHTTEFNLNSIQVDDVVDENFLQPEGEEQTTEQTTNESPEMDVVKDNADIIESSLQALIEKVVNDELTKLVAEQVQTSVNNAINAQASGDSNEQEQSQLSSTTESETANLDSETISPTNPPAVENETMEIETISVETTESLMQKHDQDKVSEKIDAVVPPTTTIATTTAQEDVTDEISNSLLSAVGDLLSSILGLENSKAAEKLTENEHSEEKPVSSDNSYAVAKETAAPSTESDPLSTSTIPYELETLKDDAEIEQDTEKAEGVLNIDQVSDTTSKTVPLEISNVDFNSLNDDNVSEVDVKIENLASAQTSFATEGTPEFIEIVKMEPTEEIKFLEVISEEEKPVSFEESVNHVMNLVKGNEGRLALRESILLDKNRKQNMEDLDQIVYGTLKELEANFGMNQGMSFEPVEEHSQNLIKEIESEISESIKEKSQIDDDTFVPSVKAPVYFRLKANDFF